MRRIVLDVENSTTKLSDKYSDYTPYNPNNKLVSIGWMVMEDDVLGEINYAFLFHRQLEQGSSTQENRKKLEQFREDLKSVRTTVAHNAKYDIQWLEEAGFDLSHLKIEDTMIREYVMARGRGDISFRLADTCKRYNVAEKGELFEKYPDLTIDQMPIVEVEEYGRADIQACAELYLAQDKRLSQDSYSGLRKTIDMSHDFTRVLIDMERAGVKIDKEALDKVEAEFTAEAEQLKFDLNKLVQKYMGDTKVNLDSPQQLSEVIYSRRIKQGLEQQWIDTFNIGKDERNKNLKRPKMSYKEYGQCVYSLCQTVMKTVVSQCEVCLGQGKIQKTKKDGNPFKKPTICKKCRGSGAIYSEINEIAGFKMRPNNIYFTTVAGFSTGSTFLAELIDQAKENNKPDAVEFLSKLQRLSSVSSYLSNFVGGINVFKQINNILHANFNQCITSTGRLSSTKPNLQNMPRENTFPIRRVFISRFDGGYIVDSDMSQVEFRAAVHMARDERGKNDILEGKDVHRQTSDIISAAGQIIDRQEAKSRTFKPLYGGLSGTEAEKVYYKSFLNDIYKGIKAWHGRLEDEAITKRIVTTETGRQFIFPDVERVWHGGTNKGTQIKNFPVQSFATADILPIASIRMHNEMKKLNLKSKLVLSVHDSLVVDTHPDELEVVIGLMKQLAKFAEEEMLKFYGIEMFVPLASETKYGRNMMEMKKVA